MLSIISKIIAAICVIVSSMYIAKVNFKIPVKILSIKNLLLLFLFLFITVILYNSNYSPFAPITIYLCMIIIYKFIFQQKLTKSILTSGVVFGLFFIADVIVGISLSFIIKGNQMRENAYIFMLSNLLVSIVAILISSIPIVKEKLITFMNKLEGTKYYENAIFILLVIIVFSFIVYNIANAALLSKGFVTDVIIMFFFFALTFIFINEKINKEKLNSEYNNLMEYVENFENWIEEEQLNNHEHKNQLAVIRAMANNDKIIKYIDDILKATIDTEDSWFNEIKELPSGGIKGLLYYKLILTKKEKIDVCLSISRDSKSFIEKIESNDLRKISRLLGIYLDNAIEAAKQSERKNISIEIYLVNSKINIVISNTYIGDIDLKKIVKKNYTTKGKGHGKGLYFANKIIKNSDNLISENSIINGYYIQRLIIKG